MKKQLRYFLALCFVALGFNSCDSIEVLPTFSKYNKSKLYQYVYAEESSIKGGFSFKATDSWSVEVEYVDSEQEFSRNSGWLEVTPDQGEAGENTIQVKFDANDTDASRIARVNIISGETSITIVIEQSNNPGGGEGGDPSFPPFSDYDESRLKQVLNADQTSVEGGFTFTSNNYWNVHIDDISEVLSYEPWIHVYSEYGDAGTHTINIDLSYNDTGAERTARIIINNGEGDLVLHVIQLAENIVAPKLIESISCEKGGELTTMFFEYDSKFRVSRLNSESENLNLSYLFEYYESNIFINYSESNSLNTSTSKYFTELDHNGLVTFISTEKDGAPTSVWEYLSYNGDGNLGEIRKDYNSEVSSTTGSMTWSNGLLDRIYFNSKLVGIYEFIDMENRSNINPIQIFDYVQTLSESPAQLLFALGKCGVNSPKLCSKITVYNSANLEANTITYEYEFDSENYPVEIRIYSKSSNQLDIYRVSYNK